MATRTAPGAGLLKGLGITLRTMFTRPSTQMYPHERPELEPRTRGVIALMDENCTVCMLCSRECPDWCIYIDSHKETVPPAREGGRARTRAERVEEQAEAGGAVEPDLREVPEKPTIADIEIEGETQVDQEVFDDLIEQGKSERMARAKAKAAWVKAEKKKLLDEKIAEWEQQKAAIEEHNAAERERAAAAASGGGGPQPDLKEVPEKPTIAEIEIEGEPQVDQAVFDELVADGKSERMARAKAKASWVKAEKRKLLDEKIAEWEQQKAAIEEHNAAERARVAAAAGSGGAAAPEAPPKPTIADVEIDEEPQIDQAVFDELVAEGKSERMARAKAKSAWVKSRKRELLDAKVAEWEAQYGSGAADTGAGDAPAEPTLGSVAFEGEVEIDQAVYDDLIAQGKSERIARAKAKAAYVKAQKQKMLDEQAGEGNDS